MIPDKKNITELASEFVYELFKQKLPSHLVYHNFKHTDDVTESAKKIAGKMNLSVDDLEVITLAALFHDTGFTIRNDNHEDASIDIAGKFLRDNNYDEEKISKIKGCINATRFPQSPKNILEEIIADADLFHLGTKDYFSRTELLRTEWEKALNKKYTDEEWMKINIDFLANHKYFTRFAKKTLDENKNSILLKLQKNLRKKSGKRIKEESKDENRKIERQKLDITKATLDEISSSNFSPAENYMLHLYNSGIQNNISTDRKALAVMSLNIFIFFLIVLFAKTNETGYPALILLFANILCIIFSAIVLFPGNKKIKYSKEDIQKKRIVFSSHESFAGIEPEDFIRSIKEVITDREFVKDSILKDYLLAGAEAERKNKYLKTCLFIFVTGFLSSVICFILIKSFSPEIL